MNNTDEKNTTELFSEGSGFSISSAGEKKKLLVKKMGVPLLEYSPNLLKDLLK